MIDTKTTEKTLFDHFEPLKSVSSCHYFQRVISFVSMILLQVSLPLWTWSLSSLTLWPYTIQKRVARVVKSHQPNPRSVQVSSCCVYFLGPFRAFLVFCDWLGWSELGFGLSRQAAAIAYTDQLSLCKLVGCGHVDNLPSSLFPHLCIESLQVWEFKTSTPPRHLKPHYLESWPFEKRFLSTLTVAWSHDDEDSLLESGALLRTAIEAFLNKQTGEGFLQEHALACLHTCPVVVLRSP